jgi:excisionase family DNA binding protein
MDVECGFLTMKEMAFYLSIHPMTLYKLVRAKKSVPPFCKIGGDYRFFKAGLNEWIERRIDGV